METKGASRDDAMRGPPRKRRRGRRTRRRDLASRAVVVCTGSGFRQTRNNRVPRQLAARSSDVPRRRRLSEGQDNEDEQSCFPRTKISHRDVTSHAEATSRALLAFARRTVHASVTHQVARLAPRTTRIQHRAFALTNTTGSRWCCRGDRRTCDN